MTAKGELRFLVLWEDAYCEDLHLLLKRMVRRIKASRIAINSDSAKSNTKFNAYIQSKWPKARRHGLPRTGPIDYLICVADADRAKSCCDIVQDPPPPGDEPVEALEQWIEEANDQWTKKLRSLTECDPERIFGRFLRWSKESILAACYDKKEVLAKLGDIEVDRLNDFLKNCKPADPASIKDEVFVNWFRNPQRCLKDGFSSVKREWHGKNNPAISAAIDKASLICLDSLLIRLPDLKMLAELLGDMKRTEKN